MPGEPPHLVRVGRLKGDDQSKGPSHARAQVKTATEDAFAWFNLGTDLMALGCYTEVASTYDQSDSRVSPGACCGIGSGLSMRM